MSISNALSNALSGLNASSRRAEVASNNIANATTEGYARQTVDTNNRVTGGRSDGVSVGPVERASDPRLSASRREADAQASADARIATGARTIADAIGAPDDPGSLFNRIAAMESSFRGVAENPESTALQERAAAAAGDVATQFNTIAETINTARTNADGDIARSVERVNSALQEFKKFNDEIGAATAGGRSTAGYEQGRDAALDTIAEYLPIRTISRGTGQLAVLTETGVTLVDGTARELSFDPTPVVTQTMDRRNGVGSLSGLTVDGVDISPGSSPQSVTSGAIAGLFEVRDGLGLDAIAELDTLAGDMGARFQQAGLAGADGRGLFTDAGAAVGASPAPGLAARLTLNEQVDPAAGGEAWRLRDGLDAVSPGPAANSTFAQSLVDAMTQTQTAGSTLSTPRSAAGLAADFGSLFERRGQTFEDAAAHSAGRSAVLLDAETSIIGVDVDQELQELILIEQAYAANARVMQVADRLVQRLLEI